LAQAKSPSPVSCPLFVQHSLSLLLPSCHLHRKPPTFYLYLTSTYTEIDFLPFLHRHFRPSLCAALLRLVSVLHHRLHPRRRHHRRRVLITVTVSSSPSPSPSPSPCPHPRAPVCSTLLYARHTSAVITTTTAAVASSPDRASPRFAPHRTVPAPHRTRTRTASRRIAYSTKPTYQSQSTFRYPIQSTRDVHCINALLPLPCPLRRLCSIGRRPSPQWLPKYAFHLIINIAHCATLSPYLHLITTHYTLLTRYPYPAPPPYFHFLASSPILHPTLLPHRTAPHPLYTRAKRSSPRLASPRNPILSYPILLISPHPILSSC
jgi:hypothetical protein